MENGGSYALFMGLVNTFFSKNNFKTESIWIYCSIQGGLMHLEA